MTPTQVHVLIVEDNALVTSATRILLENAGFRVSTAGSVGEAYAMCQSDRPDVILLDLRLPDGDGLTLLKRLQGDGGRQPIVAALTGRDEPGIRQRCLRAGCIEVLLKPVDVRALALQITSWLDGNAGDA